jgi:pimeloyl-ACP methyl ester carboxylesterase
MVRALRILPVAITLVSLILAACGGDSSSPSGTATATTTAPTQQSTPRTQPVGERLIDVGGHRLAIRCQGQAAPTVIFENGAFQLQDAFGDEMAADIARDHRVCTYDRAGTGKSEAGPAPRDARQISDELHTLLTNAGETGPFVLVSWSIGGLFVPLYAIAHPDDVQGYVFIDPRLAAYQLQVGTPPPVVAAAEGYPPAYGDEMRAWDASAAQVRDAGPLPARPLIVLTKGSAAGIAESETQPGGYALWRSSHAEFAASVPGGEQIVVDDGDHDIWTGNRQVVLDAINRVAGD